MIGAIALGVCAIGLLGLGVYAAATAFDDVGAGLLLACFALGAAFAFGTWYVLRGHRRRLAQHFEIAAGPLEVRRGGQVTAELAIRGAQRVGERLEVGLVCSEIYDFEQVTTGQYGNRMRSRASREAPAHEQWVVASRTEPVQSFRFTVPADGAFSHEGACISYAWRVTAREPADLRRDESSDQPIWVLP